MQASCGFMALDQFYWCLSIKWCLWGSGETRKLFNLEALLSEQEVL